ncbi:MAG: 50S ribosomal protein L15 [Legionellales bacterium RIFCSPHIGHO2_12_FULL_37_14]|nr:MAG: 50S ribosomal protein L15 [Legionellales bacterium RIFCSPHIGHO2_12_FULL_37_14]
MRLNSISPSPGSKRPARRVGRGIGSGLGKTSGKGHKGQKARAGGFTKINFEGGQMPIQRRLPKMGFKSRIGRFVDQVTLSELLRIGGKDVTLISLKQSGLISIKTKQVKIIASGKVSDVFHVKKCVGVTKGARAAIEQAGGSIEA